MELPRSRPRGCASGSVCAITGSVYSTRAGPRLLRRQRRPSVRVVQLHGTTGAQLTGFSLSAGQLVRGVRSAPPTILACWSPAPRRATSTSIDVNGGSGPSSSRPTSSGPDQGLGHRLRQGLRQLHDQHRQHDQQGRQAHLHRRLLIPPPARTSSEAAGVRRLHLVVEQEVRLRHPLLKRRWPALSAPLWVASQ